VYGFDAVYSYCWIASPRADPNDPQQHQMRPLIGMVTTFGGWCILALFYLLIASSTVAWVVFWRSSDVDFGGHIGLRRNRWEFNNENSTPKSPTSDSGWTGHTATGSTEVVVHRRGQSLTLVDDMKSLGKKSLHDDTEAGLRIEENEKAREDQNIHISPPKPRHPSGAVHSQYIEKNLPATPADQERSHLSRRTLALRAMTLRLIGYILIPVICILPSVITDLIVKAYPVGEVEISDSVTGFLDGLNGLVGFFNAVLFLLDPVLLVVWGELRANHCWGELQKQRREAQHGNRSAIEVDVVAESPFHDARTSGFDNVDDQVGGVRSTRFGKEDSHTLTKRAFEDSLDSSLPELDHVQGSQRLPLAGSTLPQIRSTGRRKLDEARQNGASGLTVHVQVEVTKHSDLEIFEDYLHGL
jgi:hypothetical protein